MHVYVHAHVHMQQTHRRRLCMCCCICTYAGGRENRGVVHLKHAGSDTLIHKNLKRKLPDPGLWLVID